jgi:hypothetical protein
MSVVSKVRRCTECKQVFVTPESFRTHKRLGGECRTIEAMVSIGFVQTPKGWKHLPPRNK